MKRAAVPFLALAILACNSMPTQTPRQHLEDIRAVYIVCVESAQQLIDARLVTLKTAQTIRAVQVKVGAALDAADQALAGGATVDFKDLEGALQTLKDLLDIAQKVVKTNGS